MHESTSFSTQREEEAINSPQAASEAQVQSFKPKIDNFPLVVSKHYERLGGESKSGEEGEEG